MKVAWILPSQGREFYPYIIKNPQLELQVHPKVWCTDLDYQILDKPEGFVFMIFNFKKDHKSPFLDWRWEKEPTINWIATRILLDKNMLPAFPDNVDALLPRGEVVFFQTDQNRRPVEYKKDEFLSDWKFFFSPYRRYVDVPLVSCVEELMKRMRFRLPGPQENYTLALMFFVAQRLLAKYKQAAAVLTWHRPARPRYQVQQRDLN